MICLFSFCFVCLFVCFVLLSVSSSRSAFRLQSVSLRVRFVYERTQSYDIRINVILPEFFPLCFLPLCFFLSLFVRSFLSFLSFFFPFFFLFANRLTARREDGSVKGDEMRKSIIRRYLAVGYIAFLISARTYGGGSIELTINYWRRFRGLPAAVVKHYAYHILLCYLIPPGARALLQ